MAVAAPSAPTTRSTAWCFPGGRTAPSSRLPPESASCSYVDCTRCASAAKRSIRRRNGVNLALDPPCPTLAPISTDPVVLAIAMGLNDMRLTVPTLCPAETREGDALRNDLVASACPAGANPCHRKSSENTAIRSRGMDLVCSSSLPIESGTVCSVWKRLGDAEALRRRSPLTCSSTTSARVLGSGHCIDTPSAFCKGGRMWLDLA
mmetsp:Transcript_30176/g.71001  ORF Transcript_30176/g.71001 Transcript_30176/m.71001 type:complete len:206 (+) Transcript_30176:1391-2008(+)